ncbi:MAG: sulfite exporter TauE/SafE family protein [Rhizobiaceae bacterium]
MSVFSDLGFITIALITIAALLTSSVHGATGVAGGFLMTAVLASIIGVKPVVPVISIALLISHSSRVFFNSAAFDRSAFLAITIPAVPCIILTAWGYGKMSSSFIAVVLGVVVMLSIPLRYWAKSKNIKAGKRTLQGAGVVYGLLSGFSIGVGVLLSPFMLGYGLAKEAFVATLAAIALTANITRALVYSSTSQLDTNYILLGIFVGVMTIPGNWFGRSYLRKISNEKHATYVDILTFIGALNFFWLAWH